MNFFFWKFFVDFWHRKLTLKVRFRHFLTNHNSSQDCFQIISLEHVDSWAKLLHFRTHHLLNPTTELTLYVLLCPSGTNFFFQTFDRTLLKKNSWKLTWDKFCITCCFRKVFHLSNTLVINSESLVNRFKPDSIQAMVSKSTLHPLCLIVQARFSFFASHEIELVVIEAAEAAAEAIEVGPLEAILFLRLRDSLRLSILDSESCRVPTDGNQIDFTAAWAVSVVLRKSELEYV